jgi:uncharacterized RDD family membrane protein YckC
MMNAGLTNCSTGGDPAVQSHLCATDAVEPARNTAVAETATSEPNAEPNVFPNSDPSVCPNTDPNTDPNSDLNSDSWRVEVATRLARYRTRRKPRTPRYPSLLLPFDSPESWSRFAPPSGSTAVAAAPARHGQDFTFRTEEEYAVGAPSLAELRDTLEQGPEQGPYRYPEKAPEQSAKVIEFPRSAAIPVFHPSDLADPVFDLDRPRIVEVPEILPPPPALGGMLMEPAQQEPADRRTGADFPLASASIARRALATLVDGAVLATSLAGFAAMFLRLNPVRGPLPMLAAALSVVAIPLWAAYEFLFVVYTGSTPGLRAARLRLAGFDGSPLNRRLRRWRVLASFLSAFSGGLGYLWCVLDQDGLCWHDRITRTHVQSL